MLVELLDGDIVRFRVDEQHPGIVDQYVDPAETLDRGIHAGARLRLVGNIGDRGNGIAPFIRDGLNHVIDRIAANAVDEDLGALACKLKADRFTNSSPASGPEP